MLKEPDPEQRDAETVDAVEPLDTKRAEPVAPPAPPAPTPPPFAAKPLPLAAAYMLASTLLALTQGLGMNMVTANIPQIQGAIGATTNEATWMVAAYMAPNCSLALALVKVRTQYGLRNFAEISILGFVIACLLNLFIMDLPSAIAVRFMSGIAAAPMSTLGFLYMLEPFPPEKKMKIGLPLALTAISLGAPVARLISPGLLDIDGFHGLTVLELALAMIAFCLVYLLPLTPIPRAKVIERADVVSYLFIAIGFGAIAISLTLGRLYWWFEAPWIGALLALAIASITCAVVIELNRKNPLLDIRWLASPAMLHFTGALLIFRLVLSEQTTVAANFMTTLGLNNWQTTTLYWVILGATILGGLCCAAVMSPQRVHKIHVVALILLIAGALMDANATNLTRPEQMYLSQAMIAFAGALFLPPALLRGLMSALAKGPNYILSFIIVFLTTQSLGGLFGSAVIGTLITLREKFHSSTLVEHLSMTDPLVAQRITQLGGAYARTITDTALLKAEGAALLAQQATREANVLAYNDAFLLIACIAGAALSILLVHMTYDAMKLRMAPQPLSTPA